MLKPDFGGLLAGNKKTSHIEMLPVGKQCLLIFVFVNIAGARHPLRELVLGCEEDPMQKHGNVSYNEQQSNHNLRQM